MCAERTYLVKKARDRVRMQKKKRWSDRGRTFLLEDRLKERGSIYSKTANWVCPSGREARDRTESGIFGTRSGRVAEAASLCLS